jgi:acetaldehyde dehydrogenase / alcohol dehydrogenase
LIRALEDRGYLTHIFSDINPDPDMLCIRKGVEECELFQPDMMICLGGGSPMDAGKFIRVQYEHPSIHLDDLAARFIELRLRTQIFPNTGFKIKKLICIPTTSGTASEVTPFSVITDDKGHKRPLFSYTLTPDMAIIDSSFTDKLPKKLISYAGIDAITHAVEAYVSVASNDFTSPYALKALTLLFENLSNSYHCHSDQQGNDMIDIHAREAVHHGASLAGLAFSNSFLGICHSLSHQIGSHFHLPHGLCNAILLPYVIEYNSSLHPTRMGIYPTYNSPSAMSHYATMARHLGCVGANESELTQHFVQKFQDLCIDLDVPLSFRGVGINEEKFLNDLRAMAEEAFDDQCTGANPRFPLVSELEEVLKKSFYGGEIVIEKEEGNED